MKVVLDTNVLVSGVFWSGPASHVAVSAGAQVLVSGDKDLLVLKKVSGVDILSPEAFLRRFFL
jgi:predicted nucleic acid-binding protein